MRQIYPLLFFIFFTTNLFSQESLFEILEQDNFSITNDKENTKSIKPKEDFISSLDLNSLNNFSTQIPLLDGNFLNVDLEKFSVLNPNHTLLIETNQGKEIEEYTAEFQSFRIILEGSIIGVLLHFENSIILSYRYQNKQLEINKIDDRYFLFDVNDCIFNKSFSCMVEDKGNELIDQQDSYPESNSLTPKCLELAIEIDQYTRNTFSSNNSATNWAHAIISGVSQVYASEMNLNVSVATTIIWTTTDPYASYVNSASNMLSALRNHWTSNNSSISRDLVHLMTKRSNTGTGGIAYLDVLCNNSWGYGFSSDLNNTTNFNFPNPSYSWNLKVTTHEIAHGIGSHHTHWCGWSASGNFSGGPIDNCADVEGNCPNNPFSQVGTIMSYCHVYGNGVVIDFHSVVVSQALNPGVNSASCLTTCTFYGCTDPNAINYDPNATVDDGSCIYGAVGLSASVSNVSCFSGSDGSINLSVSGGQSPFTYSWSNGSSNQDINNLSAGVYSVTVTDSQGQTASASYTVSQPTTAVSVTYTVQNPSGPGLSNGAIYTYPSGGTPPYTYYWVSPYSTNQNLTNIPAGVYTFYVIDNNGCWTSTNITVEQGQIIPITTSAVITDLDCYGDADGAIDLSVSGGAAPFTYAWNNGSTTQDLMSLSGGTYTVIITDANNQTQTSSFTVIEPDSISITYTVTNTSSSNNNGAIDITPSGGTPPYSFYWNTNPTQTTEDINNLSAGTYTVWVVDDNGCWNDAVIQVLTVIYGCTDPTAINYNPSATVDDGSCIPIVLGCTGPTYCNYNPAANVDDGSCSGWAGCMDPNASNYNAMANCNDGSCIYPAGCTEPIPTGVYSYDVINERAKIAWDNMNDSLCMVDKYRIRYRVQGTNAWYSKTMQGSGLCLNGLNTTVKQMLNLTNSTTYEYYMKAWYCGGAAGGTPWSALQTFTTQGICPDITNLTVTPNPNNNTRATFCWDTTGTYLYARVKYRVDTAGSAWINVGGFGVYYPTTCKQKFGMTPGEDYKATGRAFCDPNMSAYNSNWTPFITWTQPASIRVGEESSINNLTIYPNPSRDIFNIQFTSIESQSINVRVINLVGELIYVENLEEFSGEYIKGFNLNKYGKGIYFLEIETRDGVISKKLALQ